MLPGKGWIFCFGLCLGVLILLRVCYLQLYGPWLAVEGSHPGTTPTVTCSLTSDNVGTLSWWAIDLAQRTSVSRVKLFPNHNCGMHFYVTVCSNHWLYIILLIRNPYHMNSTRTKCFIWNCCIWNQSISIHMNDSISLWIVNQYFHVANRWMWIRFGSFLERHIPRTHRQYPNDSTRLPVQQNHRFS